MWCHKPPSLAERETTPQVSQEEESETTTNRGRREKEIEK